jgi:HEAT repeat protein
VELLEVLVRHTWRGDPAPVARATEQEVGRLEFRIRGLFLKKMETLAHRVKLFVLKESLDHDDPITRHQAALLLGRRGDKTALPELIQMLESGDEVWAIPAANVLGEMGEGQAAEALVEAIAGHLPGLHRAAAQALQEMRGPAVPALIRALGHPDTHVRWHAARSLGKISDLRAVPGLLKALEDADSGVRWLAGEALGELGDKVLEPLLETLRGRRINAFLRDGAIHVLSQFQRKGFQQVSPIIEALRSVDYPTLAPMAAYEVLQELRRIKSSK